MAGKHRTLRVALVLALASCAGPRPSGAPPEPVTDEDLRPLPVEVTPENARDVVRKALQLRRRTDSNARQGFGYVFSPEGFIQIHRFEPAGDRERESRVEVRYAEIDAVEESVGIDSARFREEARVTMRGRFPAGELTIPLPDAGAARALASALRILSER